MNATVEDMREIIATAAAAARRPPMRDFNRGYNAGSAQRAPDQRRVAPHCRVVNLVRSGRKQPQRIPVSDGITARHPFWVRALAFMGFFSSAANAHVRLGTLRVLPDSRLA